MRRAFVVPLRPLGQGAEQLRRFPRARGVNLPHDPRLCPVSRVWRGVDAPDPVGRMRSRVGWGRVLKSSTRLRLIVVGAYLGLCLPVACGSRTPLFFELDGGSGG